ncbi:MAG TPA: DUF169 domain-containing protein [Syntrophales bacterium]|nr:DUF169 domain-containing protein [Syntrophales bacterium]HOM07842.1 DUF169 domain-containing protein [Syntrophales bacterium]HOO00525.1 DUF169 domain-containing protein [Syntrophales bacterium]HPC01869.1 DUF169 domain-containing protein [Syntrophales bacterium]HPQ07335.1 DUF169 domain-containing protein [Syntrophales bacterium]
MTDSRLAEAGERIRGTLRLKTQPVAVKFLKDAGEFPNKTRRPLADLGKKVALCQAVSMARIYGWSVGIAKEDLVCVPAAIAFGFSDAEDTAAALGKLFCQGSYSRTEEIGKAEAGQITRLDRGAYGAIIIAPLARAAFAPDTVVFYGNPAQLMRLVHAWTYTTGRRAEGRFGGKVECTEYLLAPFLTGTARIAVPGTGDRVFSLTQDDEIVFAVPGASLTEVADSLAEAGKKVGATYPVPVFLNFQPEFPKQFKELGKELGIS